MYDGENELERVGQAEQQLKQQLKQQHKQARSSSEGRGGQPRRNDGLHLLDLLENTRTVMKWNGATQNEGSKDMLMMLPAGMVPQRSRRD
ncbi:hypothetical protein PR003_g25671 [Phytophthora rubi]|uniref:Uncharacterized protein n=2 Tax=Phytophthora rubi TaxID=129364 RepID=A0A6A4CCH7_9STRA|nr:hypothetical protein PR003_g25671 [Phytophthora rubi]